MLEEIKLQLEQFIKVRDIQAALIVIENTLEAQEFELRSKYCKLLIELHETLQEKQEKYNLMVFVAQCEIYFALTPQYNSAWLNALNNVETAFAYLQVYGISSNSFIYLYRHLSFAIWPPLLRELLTLPNIDRSMLIKFWFFTLAKQNLPLYEEIATILFSNLDFSTLPKNIQDYREKLQKYSNESRRIIAELHQATQNQSHFDALTSGNRKLEEYKTFLIEVFTIEGYTNAQLSKLLKNKTIYLYIVEELAKVQKLSANVLIEGIQRSMDQYDLSLFVKLTAIVAQYFPEFKLELPVEIANKKQFLLQFGDEAHLVSEILVKLYITDEPDQKLFDRIISITLEQALKEEIYAKYKNFWMTIVKIDRSNLNTLYQHLPLQVFQEILKELMVEKKGILSVEELYEFNQYILSEYNLTLFKYIEELIKPYHSEHPLPPLSLHQIKTIELLERCSPSTLEKLQQLIQQLTRGFGHILPEYDRTAAAFILAVIRQAKLGTYDYLPTIVMENNFLDYLELLIKKKNVSERFLHAPKKHSGHWRCGEIEIKNGAIKLFLINSEGLDDEEDIEEAIVNSISKRFPKTKMNIYLSQQKRQFSEMGCSAFALDDIRHLYTLTQYTQKSLFDQLKPLIIRKEEVNKLQVYTCKLPPTLLRTMQSKEIRNVLENDEDYKEEHIVTKPKSNSSLSSRGLTVQESVEQGFKFNPKIGKEQNFRLAEKLQKMHQRVDTYIIDKLYDDPEKGYRSLAKLAEEHTFPAFQQRMAKQENSTKFKKQLPHTLLGKRTLEDSANTENRKNSASRIDPPTHTG